MKNMRFMLHPLSHYHQKTRDVSRWTRNDETLKHINITRLILLKCNHTAQCTPLHKFTLAIDDAKII